MAVNLDRAEYPELDGHAPNELLRLDLPNGAHLDFRWQTFAAVVPVFHDPTGLRFWVEGGKTKCGLETSVPGTAFCVFPQFGLFVTAAHVLPDNPERALERGEVGVGLTLPGGRSILPLRYVALDRDNDIAVCCAGAIFEGPECPYLPIALSDADFHDDEIVYAAGFPDTTHAPNNIDLSPKAYAGQGKPERIRDKWTVRNRGESIQLSGDFIRVEMNARPGLSGGPLCTAQIDKTTRTKEEERNRLRGRVVGVMSWRRVDGFTETDGFFADIRAAVDLSLPVTLNGRRTLRELYDATPKRELPELVI